jgi:alanyl-tRNA synthetase
MKTKKIFKDDVYLKETSATITDILKKEDKIYVLLDQTVFFPTGGGQSCDTGYIGSYQVIDVFEEDDMVLHQIVNDNLPNIGDKVDISINWERRFDNMQRHCGEHILSGMFYREYGGVNRGFHMGDDYMTIDISLEENPEFTKITWDMAKHAELCTNQAIWNNAPVITRHFDHREDAENLPLRKALSLENDITIVCVGDINNPEDCVACCGTHPSTAGQVGLVKIYKVESNKGMFRIYFEAGKRAFLDYQNKFDILTTMENNLSAGNNDLLSKYAAQQEKNKSIKNELYQLKKSVISNEVQRLTQVICEKNVEIYDNLSIDDILSIGRPLIGKIPTILFLVHKPSNTLLLFSNGDKKYDCGMLVKENASIYNGKGGGNNTSARAIFPKYDYIETFIDLIEKHLL